MYYCLIASLEQYTLSSDAAKIDFVEIREQVFSELKGSDASAVMLLYSYYDVSNLLAALCGTELHNALGNLSADDICAEIELQGADYEGFASKLATPIRYALDLIKGFVEPSDDFAISADITERDMEQILFSNFYAAALDSGCEYLVRWVEYDRGMRNFVAGADGAVGEYSEGGASDEPWYSDLRQVVETVDFVEREHKMDSLRWRLAEELVEPGGIDDWSHDFDIAAVLSYLTKLNILQRWAMLSKDRGAERFKTMVDSFTAKGQIDLG